MSAENSQLGSGNESTNAGSNPNTPRAPNVSIQAGGTAATSTVSPATANVTKSLADWYLKIAVGGRRNFLFLEDNLTPAPYTALAETTSEFADISLKPELMKQTPDAFDDLHVSTDRIDPENRKIEKEHCTEPIRKSVNSKTQDETSIFNISEKYTGIQMLLSSNEPSVVCNSGQSMYLHGGFGQDAYFVACDEIIGIPGRRTAMLLGIADGVGGWRSSRIDSSFISHAIMKTSLNIAHDMIRNKTTDRQVLADPRELMSRAYTKVREEKVVSAGSTTVCIVSLLPVNSALYPSPTFTSRQTIGQFDNKETQSLPPVTTANSNTYNADVVIMRAANLGDSGYIVIRFVENGGTQGGDHAVKLSSGLRPQVVGYTAFQRDERNIVKQLAIIPESISATNEYFEYCDDKPEDCTTTEYRLQDGDILLLCSDGMWDNFDLEKEYYFDVPYGTTSMRIQHHINDIERIRRQHQIIERIVMESLNGRPCSKVNPGMNTQVVPQQNSNGVVDIDPSAVASRLVQHALEFQFKREGKPDDLTVMVAQIRRKASADKKEG